MAESEHTPGPWEATERHDYREIIGPRDRSDWYGRKGVWAVAYIDTDLDEGVQDANARLIAAAPDLLVALEELTEASQRDGDPSFAHLRLAARAAIAKARGHD